MKKYVFMALAAVCLAVAVPFTTSFAHAQTQQYENGQLLRIFDAASVQFAKIGLNYSVNELMQGHKAGTVTILEEPGGESCYVTSGGGNTVIVDLEDLL